MTVCFEAWRRGLLLLLLIASSGPSLAQAQNAAPIPTASDAQAPAQKPRLLMMNLRLADTVRNELGLEIENLVLSYLQETAHYDVTSQEQIMTLLGMEEQKQLTGCSDTSCMADIGGALGAGWLVTGNLGFIDEDLQLTLRLLDVFAARVENQVIALLPESGRAMRDDVRRHAYDLLRVPLPPPEPPAWYENHWLWMGAGVLLVAAGVTTYFLVRPARAPISNLGVVTF